jgi:hypothetical protein
LQQSLQQQAQAQLYEQIGTRIATDYTPWTTYPMQPKSFRRLEGSINIDKLSMHGQALFAASEFNANELMLWHAAALSSAKSSNDFFDLIKGFVLFMPRRDIQVQTREGIAYIPKGTIAWIMETGQ